MYTFYTYSQDKIKCVIDIQGTQTQWRMEVTLKNNKDPNVLIQLSLVITDSNVVEISFSQLSFKVKHEK